MVFAVISILLFLLWRLSSPQRKIVSVSFALLVGTILFIGVGLEFDRYDDVTLSVAIAVGFYIFLLVGERFARAVRLDEAGFRNVGDILVGNPLIRSGFLALFLIYALLPLLRVLVGGQSIGELLATTWASNSLGQLSETMLENTTRSASGFEALLDGVQRQLAGFWYLALGIALVQWPRRVVFPILLIFMLGTFLTGSSSRTLPMMAASLPIMIWLLSVKRPRLRNLVVLACIALLVLLALDVLVESRAGSAAEGSLGDRVERSLRVNFAYGGLGLELGMESRPDSPERGLDYLFRTAVLPIPRFIWPDKPISNPNQILTEAYTGQSIDTLGVVLLFTPLGEALFYFGYVGLALVPFLYGFTAILLERLYSTSRIFMGLLIQTYLWAFLGMRLSYFNLFSALIASNLVLLLLLGATWFLTGIRYRRRVVSARPSRERA